MKEALPTSHMKAQAFYLTDEEDKALRLLFRMHGKEEVAVKLQAKIFDLEAEVSKLKESNRSAQQPCSRHHAEVVQANQLLGDELRRVRKRLNEVTTELSLYKAHLVKTDREMQLEAEVAGLNKVVALKQKTTKELQDTNASLRTKIKLARETHLIRNKHQVDRLHELRIELSKERAANRSLHEAQSAYLLQNVAFIRV